MLILKDQYNFILHHKDKFHLKVCVKVYTNMMYFNLFAKQIVRANFPRLKF